MFQRGSSVDDVKAEKVPRMRLHSGLHPMHLRLAVRNVGPSARWSGRVNLSAEAIQTPETRSEQVVQCSAAGTVFARRRRQLVAP